MVRIVAPKPKNDGIVIIDPSKPLAGQTGTGSAESRAKQEAILKSGIETYKKSRRGRSSSSRAKRILAEAEAKRKALSKQIAEDKAIAEEKQAKLDALERKRTQSQKENIAEIERQRILQLKIDILRQGGRSFTRQTTDIKTGDKLAITTTVVDRIVDGRKFSGRVFEVKNLTTGETSFKSYELPRGGGRLRQSGGFIMGGISTKDIEKIKKTLPEGDKLIVDPKTNRIIGIKSSILNKTIPYTEQGIKFYNEQINKEMPLINFLDSLKNKGMSIVRDEFKETFKSPINIFSIQTWKEFADALIKSTSRTNRNLGQKILTYPLQFVAEGVGRTFELRYLPAGIMALAANPANITKVPGNIAVDFKETISLIQTSPGRGLGRIGSDIFTFRLIGGALKITGKVVAPVVRRMSPYFKSFKKGVINLKIPSGNYVMIDGQVFLKDTLKNLSFRKGFVTSAAKKIELKKGLLTDVSKTLAEQTKLAGTKATIVTAQANKLVNFLRRNKMLRKPIPNEANFTPALKKLLKKFDESKLTPIEFIELNKMVLKESGKTLLERSLFADPSGLVRFTRLGSDVAEASLKDILRGNFSFKKSKPQIIIFPEGQIAKFPASLKKIVAKLKAGKKLTELERTKLVKWQTTKTGQWKPIGDIAYKGGIELEVTLAPKEVIRRVKKLATTEINGVKVEIIQAKIIKLTKETTKLLNKAKKGTILKTEILKLKKLLSKATNLKVRTKDITNLSKKISKIRRRITKEKPLFPIRRLTTSKILKGLRKRGRTKTLRKSLRFVSGRAKTPLRPPTKRTPTARPPTKRTTIRIPPTRIPTARPPTRPTGRPPRAPTTGKPLARPPKKPPILLRLKQIKRMKILAKAKKTYYVKIKMRGKFVQLKTPPLSLVDARSLMAYKLDKTLARTGKIISAGKRKTLSVLEKNVKGYFEKHKKKLRPFKIKKGKKKYLTQKWIEKKKYIGDTKLEQIQLQLARKKKLKIIKLRELINKRKRSKKLIKSRKIIKKPLLKQRRKKKLKLSKLKKIINKKRAKLKKAKNLKLKKGGKSKSQIKKTKKRVKLKKKK